MPRSAPRPLPISARRVSSAPDIAALRREGGEFGGTDQAEIAGQAVLQCGQRESTFGHGLRVAALQIAMQHAGSKGIAGTDAVDNAGDVDLGGLVLRAAGIDPRGDTVVIAADDMARGRGDQFEVRKGLERGLDASRRRSAPSPEKVLPSSSEMSRWLPISTVAAPTSRVRIARGSLSHASQSSAR